MFDNPASRVGHPRMAITIRYVCYDCFSVWRRLVVFDSAVRTFSRCLFWVVVCGFHIGEFYVFPHVAKNNVLHNFTVDTC